MGSTIIAYRPFLTLLKGFKWRGICYKGPIRNGEFEKYFADSFTVFRVRNNSKVLKKTVFFLTVTTSRKDLMTWKLLLIYIKSCFCIKPYFQWFLIKYFDEIRSDTWKIHKQRKSRKNPFFGLYLFSVFSCTRSTSSKSVNVSKQFFHK